MKRKQLMAFLLAGVLFTAAGQHITIPTYAAEVATDSTSDISITESDSVIEISCPDPIVVYNDDVALIAIHGVKLDKEEGKIWYYYSIKNKTEDQYIHEYFDGESFGDYMVDYSSYSTSGGSASIPGGKWSAVRGNGSKNIETVNTLDDMKRFSATLILYVNDNAHSQSSNDTELNIPFEIDFDSLDGVAHLSDTGEVLVPPPAELPEDFQSEGATLTTTDEYAELTFDEPYIILDNDQAEIAITSLKLVYNDRIWYYYTAKNKTTDKYLRIFFDNEAFNDVMLDFSRYSREGSGDSIPAGKNSGTIGLGSSDLTNFSSPSDLLNFSGTIRLYPSDDATSYGEEDPIEGAFSIQLGSTITDTEASAEVTTTDSVEKETTADSGETVNESASVSAEDIDAMLQGSWMLQDSNGFTFLAGSCSLIQAGTSVLEGTYSVDTDAQEIKITFVSTEGSTVGAGLPYTVENGTLSIYNDGGEAMTKLGGEASDAEVTDIAAIEELEAQLALQPLFVNDTEVTDENDYRFNLSVSTDIILPHVLNQSAGNVKQLELVIAGWDADNLPVTMQSAYMTYTASEKISITITSENFVEGMDLNNDDVDTFNLVSVDNICGLVKAKAIVASYTTYDGETWTNPLLSTWEEIYVGKKLVEPVVYTDQETIRKVQVALNEAGYECGTPDGIAGAKTYEALNAYQEANGLPVTNDITDSLLQKMNLQ